MWKEFLVTTSLLLSGMAQAQIDVVSVKRTPPERRNQLTIDKCPDGGRFVSAGVPLMWLIDFAYQISDSRISGGPAWLTSFDDAYDIQAKAEHNVTDSQCRLMVRSLLVERFKIAVHKENREVRAYELLVGEVNEKKGPRLHQVVEDDVATESGGRIGGARISGVQINGACSKVFRKAKHRRGRPCRDWPSSQHIQCATGATRAQAGAYESFDRSACHRPY